MNEVTVKMELILILGDLNKFVLKIENLRESIRNYYDLIMIQMIRKSVFNLNSNILKKSLLLKPFKFQIKSFTIAEEGHIIYLLSFFDDYMNKKWKCEVRYSELFKLHQKILKKLNKKQIETLEKFPPKGCFLNRLNTSFVNLRKEQINNYLNYFITTQEGINYIDLLDIREFLYEKFKQYYQNCTKNYKKFKIDIPFIVDIAYIDFIFSKIKNEIIEITEELYRLQKDLIIFEN